MSKRNTWKTGHVTSVSTLYDASGSFVATNTRDVIIDIPRADIFSYRYEGEAMDWLKKTRSAATPKVFYALTCLLRNGSCVAYVSPRERKMILDDYGISDVSMCASLNELESAGVILRGDVVDTGTGEVVLPLRRGEIVLNPRVVWKGNGDDRKAAVEAFDQYLKIRKNTK